MYNKIECFTITCDNCGETLQDQYSGYAIFLDTIEARECADNNGWYETEDRKHYCPDCHEIDDADNLIIKKKP